MAYTFEQIFAADPASPGNVASNGVVTIFTPGDTTKTPLPLTTVEGLTLNNPIEVNAQGFGPAFIAPIDRVAWEGAGFTGFLTSYDGMKEEAVAARTAADGAQTAAEEAARNSQAPTQEAVAAALATEGPARAAVNQAVANGTANLAIKPDNGGKPVGKGELVLNVMDKGATGDGTTDDAESFNTAITTAQTFGASVYVPGQRTYYVNTAVKLRSNVRIWSDGAILKKRGGAASDRIFEAFSNGAKGYGSSVENVIIEGFIFEGSFKPGDMRGASITLHHARNIEIRNNIFRECISSGHAIDLGGCKDIRIHDNTFAGFNVQAGREYVEAIQVDYSIWSGIPGDDPRSYDALPTVNVTVERNSFIPFIKDGVTYPAPNPLGSHSRVIGQWLENIKFLDNYVEDGMDTAGITDAFSVSIKGWLHFFCARSVEIRGNTFKVTDGRSVRVLGSHAITTGLPVGDASDDTPTNVTMPQLMPMRELDVTDNTFIGFKNATPESLINLTGNSSGGVRYPVSGIRIANNRTRDCFATPGVPAYNGAQFIGIRIGEDVEVRGGVMRDIRGLGSFVDIAGLTVDGVKFRDSWWVLAEVDTCTQVSFVNLKVSGYRGGLWFRGCTSLTVSRNQFDGGVLTTGSTFGAPISINACTQWTAIENTASAAANTFTRAINIYGATTKGMVLNNMFVGFATPVTDTSAAKDAVLSGNMV